MSAEATFWAWQQEVKSTHKLVLLALANCHNEATGQCNPSVSYIAGCTSLNRKTIMTALSSLEESGLILAQKTNGNSSQYLLSTGTKNGTGKTVRKRTAGSTKSGTGTKNNTGTESGTRSGTKNGTGPVPKTVPKSKKNLKTEPKNIYRQVSVVDLPDGISEESAKALIDHRAALKKPLTQRAFDLLIAKIARAPLVGFSPQQAIDEMVMAGWQGFEVQWLQNRKGSQVPVTQAPTSLKQTSITDQLSDRSWVTGGAPAESSHHGELIDIN